MYVMIAKMCIKRKITGFRIIDTKTLSYQDYQRDKLVSMMQNENFRVENLKYVNCRFSTSPTSLEFYPAIGVEGKTRNNLVLIKYLDGFTYYAADRDGKIYTLTLNQFTTRYERGEICNVSKEVIKNARYFS